MDTEILETVIDILELSVKIGQKPNGFGGFGYQVQFSDVSLYDFLLESGITPSKSKTIHKVILPDSYYADFLRGLFDGDGCVYGFWDRRWKNSLMYYTEFASASAGFLEWIHTQNKRLIGVTKGRIKPSTRAFSLSYAKADSQKIFSYIYYAQDLPMLSRKHSKFVDFIRLDPYANKKLLGRVAESVDALD